jgi:hypothetical protein
MPVIKKPVWLLECFFEEDKKLKNNGYSNYQRIWCVRTRLNRFPRRRMAVNAETLFVEILDEMVLSLTYGKRPNCNHFFVQQSPSVYSYDIGDIGILDKKAPYKNLFWQLVTG